MRFDKFKVTNYRNIIDSGWVKINDVTAFVGQNEAGKSNLFEALYCLNPVVEGAAYDPDEDWPVDNWEGRKEAKGTLVCHAVFELDEDEIRELYEYAQPELEESEDGEEAEAVAIEYPSAVEAHVWRHYGYESGFRIDGFADNVLDADKAKEWASSNIPKFVYIRDYDMSGAQVELDQLQQRLAAVGGDQNRHKLSNEDQTILIVLDLAQIDIDDFLKKGADAAGRTIRTFDKRAASKYLTNQFGALWHQKKVNFEIEIDGPTLNIFAEDEEVGMPVRLHRRSTGFRWYVSFAWKFTHASNGDFAGCVLLLEEPGVHLHFSGQRDLLSILEKLSADNTILYTTHLASMVDLATPERVRIVESRDHHLGITQGVVSSQKEPMAVIERSLGLTGDQSGMLGSRQVLIVEGGDDALILHKLSGLMRAADKEGLSDRIYLWAAHGASKTPMHAAFAIGQKWDAGVLLDSDQAGNDAKDKINELYLSKLAEADKKRFRTFMLGKASGSKKTDCAIEDLFPDTFYIKCVNSAYGLAIKVEDLPEDGSDMITKRVEHVLKSRYGHKNLDKRLIMGEMLKDFDTWKTAADIPTGTQTKAAKLFSSINSNFADDEDQ